MKKLFILGLSVITLIACKNEVKEEGQTADAVVETSEDLTVTSEMMETAIIYEANIRQYSTEGTFNEFTKDIPQLKELGVKVIWLMPIFPISETKRKAKGDLFASDIEDPEERKKYLGSYYAVSDFRAINPEFGNIDDFRKLLKTAHDNDIYVILDWVPNHTGWDHTWLKTNPDFYTKNADGEITDPLNEDGIPVGWADVADLNYDNEALHEAMIADMNYWVEEEGIDGFRCDVAGSVPLKFWKKAIPQLRAKKSLFMLAEAWEPELLHGELFDMAYAWDGHHIMNAIAKREKNATGFGEYMTNTNERYEENDILMNFVTNHDENSWSGTVKERMGDASEAMLALSYVMPGMPLIYSGQEYDLNHKLKFFEKDSIPKTKGKVWPMLEKLGKLKQESKALNGGKNAANFETLNSSKDEAILAFKRSKENEEMIYIANMSDTAVDFTLSLEGGYTNALSGEMIEMKTDKSHSFEPWQFLILKN